MSSTFGKYLRLSLFGESHGHSIGIVIDGLPAGLKINLELIDFEMARRAPGNESFSTSRNEKDAYQILSGLHNQYTTGTPLCAVIQNNDMHSQDYNNQLDILRPGHADYTGHIKYNNFNDHRGGGHFSGRLTAPIVFAGALCKQWLSVHNINIYAHIKSIGGIIDDSFSPMGEDLKTLNALPTERLPVINQSIGPLIQKEILNAKESLDSVGGVIECMALGVPPGLGAPFFDGLEQVLAQLIFSIPGVKGLSFGDGFEMASKWGSECNDAYAYHNNQIITKTNHSGGIAGGITTGMPIIFQCAIRPTPSIAKEQTTVSLKENKEANINIKGRHDPCIVPRALPVVEAMAAIALCDLWKEQNACRI